MYVLFIFLVPAAYIYYLSGCRDADSIVNLLSYASGIVAGFCALFIGKLILLLFPHDTSSFFVKFLSIFFFESGIPFFGGVAALFFLLESPVKQRISNIRSQMFGISTIILPYIVISSYNFPDIWSVILIPVLLLSILFLADFCIGRFTAAISVSVDPLDFVFAVLPVVLAFIAVDLFKTLWYFCFPSWIYVSLSFLLSGACFTLRLLKYRK